MINTRGKNKRRGLGNPGKAEGGASVLQRAIRMASHSVAFGQTAGRGKGKCLTHLRGESISFRQRPCGRQCWACLRNTRKASVAGVKDTKWQMRLERQGPHPVVVHPPATHEDHHGGCLVVTQPGLRSTSTRPLDHFKDFGFHSELDGKLSENFEERPT